MQGTDLKRASLRQRLLACAATIALAGNSIAPAFADANDDNTASPIKHVIVIVGENRSFDHVFATFTPAHKTDTVLNALSQGIVTATGAPGPSYKKALQYNGSDYDAYE